MFSKNKDEIKDKIEKQYKKHISINDLTIEQKKSLFDIMPFSMNSIQYYRRYKSLQMFWEVLLEKIHLNQVSDDFILDLMNDEQSSFEYNYKPNKEHKKVPTILKKIIKLEMFGDMTHHIYNENGPVKQQISDIIKFIEEKGKKHIQICKNITKKFESIYNMELDNFILILWTQYDVWD